MGGWVLRVCIQDTIRQSGLAEIDSRNERMLCITFFTVNNARSLPRRLQF